MNCSLWNRWVAVGVVSVALLHGGSASALVTGTSTDNLNGTFTYTYAVDNSAGAFDIAIWSLDFPFLTPDWDRTDTFSGGDVAVPNLDWFAAAGIPVLGLSAQDFISLNPSADVLVGNMLAGFSFTSSFAPGNIAYHEFSAAGDSASGTILGPALAVSAVPDAGGGITTLGLLCLGLIWGISRPGRAVAASA